MNCNISLINPCILKKSIIRIHTTVLFQNHLQFTLKSVSTSSFCTLSTCSQGLSISWQMSLLWWSSDLSVSCLLGWESIQTGGVGRCTPLSRQYTSRSGFPCVLTPTNQGVLNLCVEFFKASLQVFRNQEWASTTSSHPWCTECLSMCQQQIPRRNHSSTPKASKLFWT